jgi:DMSO/TMAO reductase YedYZ molybdopterin-dependent catalytic subunit
MTTRRGFINFCLRALAVLAALGVPETALAKIKKRILPPKTDLRSLTGENPEYLDESQMPVTPLEKFDTMGETDHEVDLDTWRLRVTGKVAKELSHTYQELTALPPVDKKVLLICPGVFAYVGQYKGVSIMDILERAEADPEAGMVHVLGPRGERGTNKFFPMEDVKAGRVILAHQVNGVTLPQKHGYPLRIVAEGYYGHDWVKYVTEIRVLEQKPKK